MCQLCNGSIVCFVLHATKKHLICETFVNIKLQQEFGKSGKASSKKIFRRQNSVQDIRVSLVLFFM